MLLSLVDRAVDRMQRQWVAWWGARQTAFALFSELVSVSVAQAEELVGPNAPSIWVLAAPALAFPASFDLKALVAKLLALVGLNAGVSTTLHMTCASLMDFVLVVLYLIVLAWTVVGTARLVLRRRHREWKWSAFSVLV